MTTTKTKTTTCTVTTTAVGGKCGKPAIATFGGGEFGECAEHHIPIGTAYTAGHEIGEMVTITAYGKTYVATVTKITAKGTVYATFTTGVGTVKTVKV